MRARKRGDSKVSLSPSLALKQEFYASWEWRTLRIEVLNERGRVCECCGAKPGDATIGGATVKIVVDHIKPISKFWWLRLDKKNLQVLCDECNQGKGAWDQTDYRAPTSSEIPVITEAEILAAQTPSGGWRRQQLDAWGVPWPPPRGWKDRLIAANNQTPLQQQHAAAGEAAQISKS